MAVELKQVELQPASAEELNRLLEIGRLLSTVLTPEEVENLRILLNHPGIPVEFPVKTGNTSVT
jgi:hypothetical protein